MRIACVHIPQFALQTLTRIDPSLRGAPVAVVGSGGLPSTASTDRERARAVLYGPVVHACSRAAWALGVRLGMTGTAAAQISGLRVVTADAAAERETVRALADALLGVSPTVDTGGRIGAGGAHLAMYCEVPAKTRGAAFGDRLLELCTALGISARIGIADDRFTAWVAASSTASTSASAATGAQSTAGDEGEVISVPRGGSAAFLAPRPLSLLAITPEVLHMLESLGVRTLGEFAALPAPSVARPLEADYQALARGDSGQGLRPYAPESPIREDITLAPSQLPADSFTGLSTGAAVGLLAERIALRLAGRGRGAARIEVTIHSPSGGPGGEIVVPVVPGVTARGDRALPVTMLQSASPSAFTGRRVVDSADDLADAIAQALAIGLGADSSTSPYHLRATVTVEALAGEALPAVAVANSHGNGAPSLAVDDANDTAPFWVGDPHALGSATDPHADSHGRGATGDLFARVDGDHEPAVDLLGVVLSTTGAAGDMAASRARGSGWSLIREERRDSHRRMQRGKNRRRTHTVDAQTRLFGSGASASGAERK